MVHIHVGSYKQPHSFTLARRSEQAGEGGANLTLQSGGRDADDQFTRFATVRPKICSPGFAFGTMYHDDHCRRPCFLDPQQRDSQARRVRPLSTAKCQFATIPVPPRPGPHATPASSSFVDPLMTGGVVAWRAQGPGLWRAKRHTGKGLAFGGRSRLGKMGSERRLADWTGMGSMNFCSIKPGSELTGTSSWLHVGGGADRANVAPNQSGFGQDLSLHSPHPHLNTSRRRLRTTQILHHNTHRPTTRTILANAR